MSNPITGAAVGAVKGATGQLNNKPVDIKIVTAEGDHIGRATEVRAPAGYVVTGGGHSSVKQVHQSQPSADGKGWIVSAEMNHGLDGGPSPYTVYAVCLKVS
ncbi:hypothetical protein ACTVZO_07640 [Streptomyces sp. IBSNAI002]|uniref:hypothetical protein n=1 Tax=Streptomyces sp. IBSNAI002 TaxID=3457500 RepID=UPI003FD078E9